MMGLTPRTVHGVLMASVSQDSKKDILKWVWVNTYRYILVGYSHP